MKLIKITTNMKIKAILLVVSLIGLSLSACTNLNENHYEAINNDSLFDDLQIDNSSEGTYKLDNSDNYDDMNDLLDIEDLNNTKNSKNPENSVDSDDSDSINKNSDSNIIFYYNETLSPEEKIQYGLQNKYSIIADASDITINNVKRADNQNVFEASIYSKNLDCSFNAAWFDSNNALTDDYAFYYYENEINELIDKLKSNNDLDITDSFEFIKVQCFEDYANDDLINYIENSGSYIQIVINDFNDDYIDEISNLIDELNENKFNYKLQINNYKSKYIEYNKSDNNTDIKEFLKNYG